MQQTFEYIRPKTMPEALKVLAHPAYRAIPLIIQPKPLAPRSQQANIFVDLSLLGLDSILQDPDGSIHIGALATLQAMVESSLFARGRLQLLSQAAGLVTSPALRNLAGLWGAIVPPYGSPEFLLALLVLDAGVTLLGLGEKQRTVPFRDFLGMHGKAVKKGELVLEAVIPQGHESGWTLERVARTPRDEAITAAAALVSVKSGKTATVSLALAGANPLPARLTRLENDLTGKVLDLETIQTAAKAAVEQTHPISDLRGSAEYRRAMARVVVHRALLRAWEKAH
jgi:carbon-monoxide dehydrogenase medium subunit